MTCTYSMLHMETDLLFKLPTSLACEALGRWLGLKDLTNVDSAYCNHKLRSSWIQLLQADEFLFHDKISRTDTSLWTFLANRKIKVTSLEFNCHSEGSEAAEIYLQQFGQSVRKILVDDGLPVDMALVSNYCHHLTHFFCSTTALNESFHYILHRNPNMQVLHFGGLVDLIPGFLENVSMPHLHTISLNNCPSCDDAIALNLAKLSSKVTKLGLYFCNNVSNDTLATITAMFPRLRSLGLGGLQVGHVTLGKIVDACPHITDLLMYGNRMVSDAGLFKVVQGLKELRVLDIQACVALTDRTLSHIAKYCFNTLEVLYFGEKVTYDVTCAGSMFAACTKLRTVVWSAQMNFRFAMVQLTAAFVALRNVRTLLLGDGMACDSALCLVAEHCTKLQNLNIYRYAPDETDSDFGDEDDMLQLNYTGKGVFAVIQGCAQLRTVVCRENHVVNDLAKMLWQQLRPGVVLSEDDQLFCSSILHDAL